MNGATVRARSEGSEVRIAVTGEVDLENADVVEEQLSAAIDNQASSVLIDLADLEYVDSVGLRLLFSLAARLEVLQTELSVLAPPTAPARRVLELSGFAAVATLVPEPTGG